MALFLNSKEWRDFQESVGNKTFDIGDGFCVKLDGPFGKSFLYSSYPDAPEYLEEIRDIGRRENAIFFKFEPMTVKEQGTENREQGTGNPEPESSSTTRFGAGGLRITDYGFTEAVKEFQPQKTIILDLEQDEDKLLKNMHSKTRYNIRLAEKRGVRVAESDDFDAFWNLLKKTGARDQFHTHPKTYYEKLFALDNVKLFSASRKAESLHAVALVIFDSAMPDQSPVNGQRSMVNGSPTATYLHGASNYEYRKHMGPHALHWHIIKQAKERGCKKYDLWGIDEDCWPGVTGFKRGFSGKEVEYVGSFDLPLQKLWYWGYRIKNW